MTGHATVDDPESALWTFCLRVYAAPGVEPACLALQDEAGADIPLLLAALWSAVEGTSPLDGAALTELNARVAPWRHNVVRPLRETRRWIKANADLDAEPLRQCVKAAELRAERRQLGLIAAWLAEQSPTTASSVRSGDALHEYLHWAGIRDTPAWIARLQPLSAAVWAISG